MIEQGRKVTEITTTVRDRNGNLVLNIAKSHWTVFPKFYSDKNYTKDSLEVMDNAGHVIFQVRLVGGIVRLQGEWWDDQGKGLRIVKAKGIPKDGGLFIPLDQYNQYNDRLIDRIFQYPSKDHWGEYED